MKKFTNLILHDNALKYSFFSSAGLFVLFMILFIFQYGKFPPIVPLFNSLPWGRSRLVPVQIIFLVPAFLIVISLFNLFLTNKLYKRYTILARMLSVNILLAVILALIAFIQIILLVF